MSDSAWGHLDRDDPAAGLEEVDFDDVGPAVGTVFPDVILPDQSGSLVDLHGHRQGRKAMVVFHRSADW